MKSKEEFLKEVGEAVHKLYTAYGSGSGYLFGIPPNLKAAVAGVVKVVIKDRISKQRVKEVIDKCSLDFVNSLPPEAIEQMAKTSDRTEIYIKAPFIQNFRNKLKKELGLK